MIWLQLYLALGGAWAISAALFLAMGWGEEKFTRPAARALILTPIWPLVAAWGVIPLARLVWKATGWR